MTTSPTATTTDPVCGMSVEPATAPASVVDHGETYYFCSEDCYQTFKRDPSQFT
jgi:YHS domain-containing protein